MTNHLKHVAIIMDGNRRYARKNKLMPWLGHKKGLEVVEHAIECCFENSIPYLSLYTFSLENFNRSKQEVSYLFSLLVEGIKSYEERFIKNEIRIKFIGNRSLFPDSVIKSCREIEEKTQNFNKLQLQALFCYGSQQEIVDVTKKIATDVCAAKLKLEDVTPKTFSLYLWDYATPNPDLIIRTGGTQRLSNFMLYQAAYAELYFTPTLWPEMRKPDFDKAIAFFNESKRNFGS